MILSDNKYIHQRFEIKYCIPLIKKQTRAIASSEILIHKQIDNVSMIIVIQI